MTRIQDLYPFERNQRALIMRVGIVAAVGTSTVDVDMPGGARLNGVPSTFSPKVGAQIVVLLDRDSALAVGPVVSGAPAWTPSTGMKVFQAQQTIAQSMADSTFTPLTWNTVEDPYGSWASGASSRFKPTFAGSFLLNGAVMFSSSAPATYAKTENRRTVAWRLNGAALPASADLPNPATIALGVVARPYLCSLNGTTDYIELAGWHNAGAALNTYVGAYGSTITVTYAGP